MADRKRTGAGGAELVGGGTGLDVAAVNIALHVPLDVVDEGLYVIVGALGDELDPAVGEVLDVPRNWVTRGNAVGCVSEPDALDVAGKIDRQAYDGPGGWGLR